MQGWAEAAVWGGSRVWSVGRVVALCQGRLVDPRPGVGGAGGTARRRDGWLWGILVAGARVNVWMR